MDWVRRGGAGVVDLGCELGWVGCGGLRVWERETACIGWRGYGRRNTI